MAKYRIFQIAKEYGLSSKEAMTVLSDRGFLVKSHLGTVGDAQKAMIAAYILAKHKTPLTKGNKNKSVRFFERYKLFMDVSSLLKQNKAFDFFLYAIELIQLTGNKVIIPKIAVKEIEKTARQSTDKTIAQRAFNILSLLSLLSAGEVTEICYVQKKSQIEGALHVLFKRHLKTHDILLITQDSAFARAALTFKRPKCAALRQVCVKRLSANGALIDLPQDKTPDPAAAPSGKTTKQTKKQTAKNIYCVPFYTDQALFGETGSLKRIIIDGNPTNYCVSQTGRVYKITYEADRNNCAEVLREVDDALINGGHYKRVSIKVPGKNFIMNIHRLVALAFCDQAEPEDKTVDHVDGNRFNNHYTNLEWVTQEENWRRAKIMQEQSDK